MEQDATKFEVLWEISDEENEDVLYRGRETTLYRPFSLLPEGTYFLTYRWHNSRGEAAGVRANFQIMQLK